MSNESKNDDILLVKGCGKNDSRCQKVLFDKYYGKMLAVSLRYCKNREDARDVLQEGFTKIFKYIGEFRSDSSLETWMKKIIVNTAIDRYRLEVNKPTLSNLDDNEWHLQATDEESLQKDEIMKCMQLLPTGYRMILNLYAVEGFSHKEISQMLNISEGTSKSQLSKARAAIKGIMSKLLST